MLNEWQEFLDYTGPVRYQAVGKRDTTWLGRFTFEALRDFSGLARILTILARGFLFHEADGTPSGADPRNRVEKAHRGLCAWCSIPEKPGSRKEWQYHTEFAEFHGEFPELVDEAGLGCPFCAEIRHGLCEKASRPGAEELCGGSGRPGKKV